MADESKTRRRVSGSALLIALSFVAVGAVLILLGAWIGDLSDYDKSIFVNVGTAVGLIAPLFLAERILSAGIGEARERAEAAEVTAGAAEATAEAAQATAEHNQSNLDELTRQFSELLGEKRAADDRLRGRFLETQSQSDLVDLYQRAAQNRSIDRRGLRIAADRVHYWTLVRAFDRAPEGEPMSLVELTFETGNLKPVGSSVIWSPGETAAEVFVRLATELQTAGQWPGDEMFRPAEILPAIADALVRIIDIRTGPRGDRDVRQIIELVDDWAITREGLDSTLSSSAWAENCELVGDSSRAFQRLQAQVRAMGWSDWSFRQAFGTAERIHAALEERSPGRVPPL